MRDFLTRFALGQTTKEIAVAWNQSDKNVQYFWAMAKAQFKLQCPQEAVFYALRQGWIKLDK